MTAYETLMAYQRDTCALAEIAGRLGWDQETMMPRGAVSQRAEECAALEKVLHARRSDPQLGDMIAAAEQDATDAVQSAQLREIRRSYDRTTRIPERLAAELARVTSLSQGIWAEARQNDDMAGFAPTLAQVIDLQREYAAALADGGDPYDALLEDYEPGMTAAQIQKIFDEMRPALVDLRARALDAPQPDPLTGTFDEAQQLELSALLAKSFGYDLSTGRIDKAVHPFSSGSGLDVRITTRTDPADPFNCLYSTIHEVGHACYEQGINPAYLLTPLGRGASMGVHESQSRIYENQLARSRPYTAWLFQQMRDRFGDFGIADAETFYRVVNRVSQGFIRTEADEVQYNLHIMLRFDLEQALIRGDLEARDLEGAWNDRFLADFGHAVDRASNGCLQDVHWSVGLFGYFPTYALGNVYAGCLYEALRADLPDLDDQLAQGVTTLATDWLRDKIHRHGSFMLPQEVIPNAVGKPVSAAPLLEYLGQKFPTA